MKRPVAPPPLEELLEKHKQRLPEVLRLGGQPTVDGHYIHWDKLRRKIPLPLRDTRGRPFLYMLPDRVHEALHRIDRGASGRIGVAEAVTNPATRDTPRWSPCSTCRGGGPSPDRPAQP